MDASTVAVVGSLVIGGAGIGGMISISRDRKHTAQQAKLDHGHAAEMARAARMYEARKASYAEAVKLLERVRTAQERTHQLITIGEPLALPDEFNQEEWEQIMGLLVVVRSNEVKQAVESALKAHRAFFLEAVIWQQEKDTAKVTNRMALDKARAEAGVAIDVAEGLMARELAAL